MNAVKSIGILTGMLLMISAGFLAWGGNRAEKARQVKLKVEGMTCAGCAKQVESALKKIPDVEKAEVLFEKGQATVQLRDANSVAPDSLAAVVTRAGYKASVLDRKKGSKDDLPSGASCCRRGA